MSGKIGRENPSAQNIRAQKELVVFAIPILYFSPILSTCHVADRLSPGSDCRHKKWFLLVAGCLLGSKPKDQQIS